MKETTCYIELSWGGGEGYTMKPKKYIVIRRLKQEKTVKFKKKGHRFE